LIGTLADERGAIVDFLVTKSEQLQVIHC
jgi:hypothetical protein